MTDDIPTADTLRLNLGELTANEVRVAQAAIRFDRSQRSETVAQTRDAALVEAVAIMDDERNQRGATKACDGLWTARTRVAALRTIPPEDPVAEAARVNKETLACCRLAARLADEGCSAFDVAVAIAARRKPAGGP